jgi:predicted nucleotidyltransferase component of viral defense system
LLKGGTLLSKVDLGFKRMSEDADLVVPSRPSSERRSNVWPLNNVRDAFRRTAALVGVRLPFPDGQHFERGAHRQWELLFESDLGQQSIKVEASLRPLLRPPRRVHLAQRLAEDTLIGSYASAFCYALDADEARAEKVRAAFTREAIRDLYDLDQQRPSGRRSELAAVHPARRCQARRARRSTTPRAARFVRRRRRPSSPDAEGIDQPRATGGPPY